MLYHGGRSHHPAVEYMHVVDTNTLSSISHTGVHSMSIYTCMCVVIILISSEAWSGLLVCDATHMLTNSVFLSKRSSCPKWWQTPNVVLHSKPQPRLLRIQVVYTHSACEGLLEQNAISLIIPLSLLNIKKQHFQIIIYCNSTFTELEVNCSTIICASSK